MVLEEDAMLIAPAQNPRGELGALALGKRRPGKAIIAQGLQKIKLTSSGVPGQGDNET